MVSNDYDIVNLALVRLGAKRITSLSDGSRNANEANAIYEDIRDEVLRSFPWSFATRKVGLIARDANVLTITDITQADPGVVTYTGTDPKDGEEYEIESVVGMTEVNDTIFLIGDLDTTANTFSLYDQEGEEVDTSAYTAYTSGGTATEQLIHEKDGDWEYVFDLPSDTLRVLKINEDKNYEYMKKRNRIFCNEDEVRADIIFQVTDVTEYDATFVDAFAWRLAQELAVTLTGSLKKLEAMMTGYARSKPKAEAKDGNESSVPYPSNSRYKDARR